MLLPTPRRPMDEQGRCGTCHNGCGHTHTDPGCAHYGCYGAHPTRDCPGVVVEEEVYRAACQQRRAEEARMLNRRARLAHAYDAAVRAISQQ